jgi:rhodanese-related sulfurtransferase
MDHLSEFIVHHWELCLALGVILIAFILNETKSYRDQNNQVTPQDAVLLINHEQACIVDIREASLFEKGHIIESLRIDKDDVTNPKLKKYKDKPIILVCNLGKTSQQSASQWIKAGFKKVHVLSGGITAWREAGLPIVK